MRLNLEELGNTCTAWHCVLSNASSKTKLDRSVSLLGSNRQLRLQFVHLFEHVSCDRVQVQNSARQCIKSKGTMHLFHTEPVRCKASPYLCLACVVVKSATSSWQQVLSGGG